jgi:hypothetical protein
MDSTPNTAALIDGLEGYIPTIPEHLTKFYLECNGLSVKDENIAKLVSLSADKVLVDILHATQQRAALRKQATKSKDDEALELDDLEGSLAEMRIFLRRKRLKTAK